MIPIEMQEREEKKRLDTMKGKLQVKTKKVEGKAEEEEWDEMEGKPHAIVKTEKEFDDMETMRLAEEKAKKVVVKKQSRRRQGQRDKWREKGWALQQRKSPSALQRTRIQFCLIGPRRMRNDI